MTSGQVERRDRPSRTGGQDRLSPRSDATAQSSKPAIEASATAVAMIMNIAAPLTVNLYDKCST